MQQKLQVFFLEILLPKILCPPPEEYNNGHNGHMVQHTQERAGRGWEAIVPFGVA